MSDVESSPAVAPPQKKSTSSASSRKRSSRPIEETQSVVILVDSSVSDPSKFYVELDPSEPDFENIVHCLTHPHDGTNYKVLEKFIFQTRASSHKELESGLIATNKSHIFSWTV